ncbi:UPF0029-domain-containing protein [Punctularia strigosozonata HHB-11173 SS5]|uniref:UPF0029-domain-containing protein n=1 Tax=Punctularia strigosozonata (strain HHB-11173) TaxID=741275 RepID=UPI0004416704|nr:UPF0029-domain-containing protein [Punctularia strigosozonata HHB-11173 SS5]EIN10965.1 UPF0029-domain-containing protein [Punctularia strigosozonata HHB-11173 SS5]
MVSRATTPEDRAADRDYAAELEALIGEVAADPEREVVASEISVLQSIYEPGSIRIWHPPKSSTSRGSSSSPESGTIRYEIHLNLPDPCDSVPMRILVSLPPTYPASSPPQLQLLSRYIGAFSVDSALFGSIIRTYISTKDGVEWTPGAECVFDGIQNVLERCVRWYEDRLSVEKAGELLREEEKEMRHRTPQEEEGSKTVEDSTPRRLQEVGPADELPAGIGLVEADSIVDRKSVFVGRACRITHPSQVPAILSYLMSDRRIARAAHPIINAWRCQVGAVLHQDNDDDGETAAGGRLAHLLQILEVNNVLVVVTRYFGGIHLGPDRFKHINQAARNALELGGFLDDDKEGSRAKARGKKK